MFLTSFRANLQSMYIQQLSLHCHVYNVLIISWVLVTNMYSDIKEEHLLVAAIRYNTRIFNTKDIF